MRKAISVATLALAASLLLPGLSNQVKATPTSVFVATITATILSPDFCDGEVITGTGCGATCTAAELKAFQDAESQIPKSCKHAELITDTESCNSEATCD